MKLNLETANKHAQMADIAYKDAKEAKKVYKKLGYPGHSFLEVDGAQCHIVWNGDTNKMAICFRGTEPSELSDVRADLNALPKKSMTDGWVHSGFRGELDKLWEDILKKINLMSNYELTICGHSLGAAMATICTSRIEEFKKVRELYTFGSPRAGTRSFVRGIKTTHWRFVNNNDVVTTVPLALMGYKHHGSLCYINHYGNIRKMTLWQRIKDKFRGLRSGLLDGVKDHGMGNYVNCTIKED